MALAAHAQKVETVPARTLVAIAALETAKFEEVQPGLTVLRVEGDGRLILTAFRIDQKKFRLSPIVQTNPDGESVDAFGKREKAVLAINGGFFGEKETGKKLFAVGLLRIGGKELSGNWSKSGGYLLFGKEGLAIAEHKSQAPERPATILQSKPLLIAPGGKWSMNTNQEIWRPRTLICLLPEGGALVLVVSGLGMSLYEAGWLLRGQEDGGYFGCDSALALDGGGSTQLWVSGRRDLSVAGETAVHNAIVVLPRG